MPVDKAFVVAGSGAALAALEPLLTAHRQVRPVIPVACPAEIPPLLHRAAGVLLVGGTRATPGRALPGPFLYAAGGTAVPAGWIPDSGPGLAAFAQAAAAVQGRSSSRIGPFVLLGEFEARALEAVSRVADVMPDTAVLRWTADRLTRPALIQALGVGAAAALYFGHGVAGGWAGYGGFGTRTVAEVCGQPLGAVLSLSCSTASRPRRGSSFAEALVMSGRCAAALGACRRTLHRANVDLGLALGRALALQPAVTLGELLLLCNAPTALTRYRIVGDPLAPLAGAHGSIDAAHAVFAPAPDEALRVVPLSDWAATAA